MYEVWLAMKDIVWAIALGFWPVLLLAALAVNVAGTAVAWPLLRLRHPA